MEIVLADERETAALVEALAMLGSVPVGQLDLDRLIDVHRVLLSPAHPYAGRLREGRAEIRLNGRVHKDLPAPAEAQELARRALRWLNEQLTGSSASNDPVLLAADIMFLLTQAHPFIDGNGRVARAVADWADPGRL